MKKRENTMYLSFKNLTETKERLAAEEVKRLNEKVQARESFKDNYYAIREMKARKDKEHAMLMEAARDDAFATVVKAIYITALEAEALTDEGIVLAESMVDNWIKESGGASKILGKVGNNTYLLARITQLVEAAAEDAVKEIEANETDPVEDESIEDKKDNALDSAKEFIKNADNGDIKDFVSKVVDSIQANAEEKGEEKADPDTADNTDSETDGAEDSAEVTTSEPAEDEPVEATDTENGTPDTDPELDLDNNKEGEASEEGEEEDTSTEAPKDAKTEPKAEEDTSTEAPAEEPATEEETPAEDEAETAESDAEEAEVKADEAEADATAAEGEAEEAKADTAEEEAPTEPEGAEEESEESEAEEEDAEDTLDADFDDDSDDQSEELGEPLDDDDIDSDTTVDGDTEGEGEIFDDLEKEEDVQKAIELIKTRVADAEETFIRNNAEDKKKMDEILNKISTNVKTVEDLADKDETKAEIAKESVRMDKRRYDAISTDRPVTIFEKMARNLGANIVKNEAVKESYLTEEGTLDVNLVVESAKVMYGFLETLNTLQLEKVDPAYIKNVLENMD